MSVLVLSENENVGEQLLDELETEAVAPPRSTDERANVPVSVVTERFLRAIVDQVPLDRIEELHLFSALRQGTVETGIAVVAARVIVPDEPEQLPPLELALASDHVAAELSADAPHAVEEFESVDDIETPETVESIENEAVIDDVEPAEAVEAAEAAEADHDIESIDDSPYADDPAEPDLVEASVDSESESESEYDELDDSFTAPVGAVAVANDVPQPPRVRHTVYTARYRLIIKGPERGKWEMDVVDEADAPLLAVETVVRGVQRRAGEETETVRYDASQLARVLRLPLPE